MTTRFFLILPLLFLIHTTFAQGAGFKVSCIGFYNLENLFDTENDSLTNDEDFTPTGSYVWTAEKYRSKQNNMADVVRQISTEVCPQGLSVLGVAEVENRRVLEDLVANRSLVDRNYQIAHFDSPDERGIDVGLLYNPSYFQLVGAKSYELNLQNPTDTTKDRTRDMLLVTGLLDGDTVHVMVNHWPSRRGGMAASEWARIAAAKLNRAVADSLLAISPDANIIIMGDLNDDPNNKSLTQGLNAKENPKKMGKSGLYNPFLALYKEGGGTLAYRDSWNLFDQMVISKALASQSTGPWFLYRAKIFRAPFLLNADGPYKGYPHRTFSGNEFLNGYSDHLPVYGIFMKKQK